MAAQLVRSANASYDAMDRYKLGVPGGLLIFAAGMAGYTALGFRKQK